MWALYLDILVFTIGLSNAIVGALAITLGHSPSARDFLLPAAIQFLLVSLVFILRELVRMHDARVEARAITQRMGPQLADLRNALRTSTLDKSEFSRGGKTWSS